MFKSHFAWTTLLRKWRYRPCHATLFECLVCNYDPVCTYHFLVFRDNVHKMKMLCTSRVSVKKYILGIRRRHVGLGEHGQGTIEGHGQLIVGQVRLPLRILTHISPESRCYIYEGLFTRNHIRNRKKSRKQGSLLTHKKIWNFIFF